MGRQTDGLTGKPIDGPTVGPMGGRMEGLKTANQISGYDSDEGCLCCSCFVVVVAVVVVVVVVVVVFVVVAALLIFFET